MTERLESHARAYALADTIVQAGLAAQVTVEPRGHWTVVVVAKLLPAEMLSRLIDVAANAGADLSLSDGELRMLPGKARVSQPALPLNEAAARS